MSRAILFDLDGTLVDTAPDMAGALNALLAEHDKPSLPLATIRPHVSNGSAGLARLGFGPRLSDPELRRLVDGFLRHYQVVTCVDSLVFAPLSDLLSLLDREGVPWGIVTNKPQRFSEVVVAQLGLAPTLGCLISGDSLPERKPHPLPLVEAARRLAVNAADCVYVGDDERDVDAGRAAGMTTVVAGYGYLQNPAAARQWPADAWVDTPTDLVDWLLGWLGNDGAAG